MPNSCAWFVDALQDVLLCVLRVPMPTVFGFEAPWQVFLLYDAALSFICHTDTMTNSLFLAKLPVSADFPFWVKAVGGILWLLMLKIVPDRHRAGLQRPTNIGTFLASTLRRRSVTRMLSAGRA